MLNDVVIANKTYAKLNVPADRKLDEIAINVIRQDIPDFLLPMKMISIDGETEIRYELGDGTRLSYMQDTMSKKDFMILMENMLRPFKICNDWFLDYHKLHLDKNYIIVGRNNSGIKYIYIPDGEHAQSEEQVLDFFRDFILSINLTDDPVYIMNLYRLLREKNASLLTVLDYLVRETVDNNIAAAGNAPAMQQPMQQPVQQRPMQPAPQPAPMMPQAKPAAPARNNAKPAPAPKAISKPAPAPMPAPVPQPAPVKGGEFGKSDMQGDLINNLFGEVEDTPKKKQPAQAKPAPAPKEKSSKGGLFGGLFGGGNKDNAPKPAPQPMQNQQAMQPMNQYQMGGMPQNMAPTPMATPAFFETEDVTCIGGMQAPVQDGSVLALQLEEDRGYQFPKYVEIELSKGYATVGRFDKAGNPQSDFNFEASLSFVSRRHFRVEKAAEGYKIIDLGSGNGTMLNGQILVPNMPYPMKSGDRIGISKNHKVTYKVC